MKKLLAVIFSLAVLAGCAADTGTEVTETSVMSDTVTTSESTVTTTETTTETTTTTTTVSETASETTSVTTAFVAEKKLPIDAELCINADGTLNDAFTKWLINFAMPTEPVWVGIFPALWDFDEDGIPEIVLTYHNGGQGRMPSHVYSAETLEEIGEFKGFCRDGFTRFINTDEGTVIYNFYEHSVHIMFESVEKVRLKNGKLVSESETMRNWSQSSKGECNPRLEFWEAGSSTDKRDYSEMTAEYYGGNVCMGSMTYKLKTD